MRWTLMLLLLCLTTAMSAIASDNSAIVWPSDLDTRTIRNSGTLDDEQPDTLLYDNNAPQGLYTATGYWARVKFTPQVDFTILSVYMTTIDGNTTNPPCSVFVYTATPAPGGEQATAIFRQPYLEFAWMDVNFQDTITVTGGQDFWVIFGPIAGGPQNDGLWNPVYDNAATAGRSGISTTGKFGNYAAGAGDWLFRIGGIAGGQFVDLAADDLYNEVNGDPRYNFPLGEAVVLHQIVTNIGTQAADAYVAEFTITGPDGQEAFSEELVGTDLDPDGGTVTLSTSSFTPTLEGEYVAQCNAIAGGDDNGDNNSARLRFFVGGNHRWYRYDDDAGADNYTGFSAGNGWALKMEPGVWPAHFDQFRIDLGGAGTGSFKIWMNDAGGLPTVPPVWTATPAVVAGWNVIDVSPAIELFEGQGITIGYLYQTGIAMGYDIDAPNCGDIAHMDTITYQLGSNGDQIFFDDGGNLCIQAYFDTTSAVAPFPLIHADRDTIDFGRVNNNGVSVDQILTISNEGGGANPLNVTSIVITPNAVAIGYQVTPTVFSVPSGETRDVTITFNPTADRFFNGTLTINSNAGNTPALALVLRGEGDSTVSAVRETNLPLPNQFSLNQNYPNPFNPSTEIQFSLPVQSNVHLTVVNMLGQEVAVLADGNYPAGVYTVSFDAANMPSGLYFYRIDAGNFTSVRKMMLLK